MPIAYTVELGSIAESMPTGATFATMTFTVKNKVDLIEEDSTTFQSFLDWIEWSNTFILAKWDEHNKQDTGASDEDLVADFGHYVSFVKKRNKWFFINDEMVREEELPDEAGFYFMVYNLKN